MEVIYLNVKKGMMTNELYESAPWHWSTIVAAGAALALVIVAACWCVGKRRRRRIYPQQEMEPRCYARRDLGHLADA